MENPNINTQREDSGSETQIDCGPETNEGYSMQERERSAGALQDHEGEVAEPQLPPLAEMSAEARLEKERKRMKRVAVLTDIGERMLVECRLNREENARHFQWMKDMAEQKSQADERRFQRILQEGERDRAVFQQAMDRKTNAILAAVDALRDIGDVFRDIKDIFTQQAGRRRNTRAIASSEMLQAEPSSSNSSSVQSGVVATRGTVHNSTVSALVELPASSSSQIVAEGVKTSTSKRGGGLDRASKGKKPRRYEP